MSLLSTIKIALKAIYANKLRSILTMLGIIIGIASVLIVVSIGQGATKAIKDRICNVFGENTILIVPRVGQEFRKRNPLTFEDCKAIENESSFIIHSSPELYDEVQVIYENENCSSYISGVSENYCKIKNWELSEGEFFTEEDLENGEQVCILSSYMCEKLFPEEYPIGKFIRIKGIPFRVNGVFKKIGMDDDKSIYIPYTTFFSRINKVSRNIVHCSINPYENIEEIKEDVRSILRQRHSYLKAEAEDDFRLFLPIEFINKRTETTKTLALFLSIIASISLLVGGIGIMNIMLVSVTERIREIGIRMALGARRIDILKQFLLESMILSLIGGLIGTVIGIVISQYLSQSFSDLKAVISIESIIISFLFSAGIGIFFGFYPAWQASKLDPIEAIRNESDGQISLIKTLKSYMESHKVISFWVIAKLLLKTIYTDKIKEFLAIIGIIIGVASVITMISVGQGVSKSIQDSISLMGKNLINIRPEIKMVNGVRNGVFHTLKIEDSHAIANEFPFIIYSSPVIRKYLQIVYGNKNCRSDVYGVSENYYKITNWEIADGEFFTEEDLNNGNQVCLLGSEVVKELFNKEDDPIDQFIRIKNIPFRVIGILKPKGTMYRVTKEDKTKDDDKNETKENDDKNKKNSLVKTKIQSFGTYDDCILIPYTVAHSRLNKDKYLSLLVCSIADDVDLEESVEEIKLFLRQRHKLQEDDKDDFEIETQISIQEAGEETTNLFRVLLLSIALISLTVGGIGIMNVMLVSVTGRTKEIGIRMSVGARRSDILKQFLFESMQLSITGGIIGIILGIVISQYVPHFFKDLNTIISVEAIIISFLFSVGVGIFFGFYPAWQASKLDPIEALRYE